MARTPYSLNSYTGSATGVVLSGSITNTATTITLSGYFANWSPLGSTGGWFLTVDQGTFNEEKVYVPSGSWTYSNAIVTFSGITRGIDNTANVTHSGGVVCVPTYTATEASEANYLVNSFLGGGIAPVSYWLPPTYLYPYKSWTEDPQIATAVQTLITGTCYYGAIWIPTACSISGISLFTSIFAATDTIYLGLYNTTTQVAVCSGIVGGTTGFTTALVSGGTYSASPGLYYIGLVVSGSSSFAAYGSVIGLAGLVNMGRTPTANTLSGTRQTSVVIGQRALMPTVSGSLTNTALGPWFALS